MLLYTKPPPEKDYTPTEYEAPILSNEPLPVWLWADTKDCKAIDVGERLTYSKQGMRSLVKEVCVLDEHRQRWRNPMGKTGINGHGLIGRFGPNHAADCIVTRINPETQKPGHARISSARRSHGQRSGG